MIQAVLPALELLQLQLKEEIGALVELSQLAREHGDPVTVRGSREGPPTGTAGRSAQTFG